MLSTLITSLTCDRCNEAAHDTADGWLILTSLDIGLSTSLEHRLCPSCKGAVYSLLGFKSHKDYVSMVKAYAELERSLEAKGLQKQLMDIPFYLFDVEEDSE